MYNVPRAATIRCVADGTLWALERATFKAILQAASRARTSSMAEFLKKVEVLSPLTEAQRDSLSNVMEERRLQAGEVVCTEGEAIDCLLLVREGELAAHARTTGELIRYGGATSVGDAMLESSNALWEASVSAVTPCLVLTLSRAHFTELLGESLSQVVRDTLSQRVLGSMGFFKELTDGERASLLSEMEETSPFAEGVDIVRQGTQGDSFYVIKSGRHALSPCPSPSRRAHGAPVSALVHRPMPI